MYKALFSKFKTIKLQQPPKVAERIRGGGVVVWYEDLLPSMRIRDAFIASAEVTRCVCRTPISPFLESPTSKPLEPSEGRAAGQVRRKFVISYTLGFHHL